MSSSAKATATWSGKLALVASAAAAALLLPTVAVADPKPVPAPEIAGSAPLPGPIAETSKASTQIKILKAKPDRGVGGTAFTLSASDLPENRDVSIVWATANTTWILDARPETVDYLGRKADNVNVVIGTARTDAKGNLSVELKMPRDFGGIHDVYVVSNGVQLAKGGVLIDRYVSITPKKGAVGTRITIKMTGLGSSLYGSSGNVYYDSHYAGVFTGVWNRGEAIVQVRAAGPVGKHTIVVAGGMQFNYLNYQQSPIPWATGAIASFTVTKDAGPPPSRIDWPLNVKPTVDAKTTLAGNGLDVTTGATASVGAASGPVLSKVDVTGKGLKANTPVSLQWSTVVGNRVNCTGTCWTFASIPLGTATAGADGSVKATVEVPDGLGGWHVIQLLQGGEVMAQVPFFVKRSLVEVPKTVKQGQPFTVHLKGVGWTQLDNTVAVTYDNSYIGYGCGFNSNGDVVLNLVATGGPGTHLIDIYPLLYTYQPAYPYPPHGMVPLLSFARDAPGLALGYQLPAFRLAIRVVK